VHDFSYRSAKSAALFVLLIGIEIFPNTSNTAVSAKALSFLRNSRSNALIRLLSNFYSGVTFALFVGFSVVLTLSQACVYIFTCSEYNPLTRPYSFNSTSDSVAVSSTTENFSSLDHLSNELTFNTFKPEVLNCFYQLYRVKRLMPSALQTFELTSYYVFKIIHGGVFYRLYKRFY